MNFIESVSIFIVGFLAFKVNRLSLRALRVPPRTADDEMLSKQKIRAKKKAFLFCLCSVFRFSLFKYSLKYIGISNIQC